MDQFFHQLIQIYIYNAYKLHLLMHEMEDYVELELVMVQYYN